MFEKLNAKSKRIIYKLKKLSYLFISILTFPLSVIYWISFSIGYKKAENKYEVFKKPKSKKVFSLDSNKRKKKVETIEHKTLI